MFSKFELKIVVIINVISYLFIIVYIHVNKLKYMSFYKCLFCLVRLYIHLHFPPSVSILWSLYAQAIVRVIRKNTPCLVWLSGLSTGLWSKGSLVQSPVRAQAWVSGPVPSRGCTRGNHTLMFLSLSFSLPSSLSNNK